jgi:hypothetical protein
MPKTRFKVRAKQWDYFNRECKVMSLRRDDLIDRLLPGELSLLETMPPCDPVGSKWVKDRWTTMWNVTDVEMVNAPVMLSDSVLIQLNQTCMNKNIPRDAFFDCFVEYLTGRLIEPALVIKDPRTGRDLGSQVAALMMDDDLSDMDIQRELFAVASDWIKTRNVSAWISPLYQERLSYSVERVETDRLILEHFAEGAKKSRRLI